MGLTGSVGLFMCGSIYLMHRRVQRNITKGIPYQMALLELDTCTNLCKLLGKPISILQLDLSDKGNRIDRKCAHLKIPLAGTKRSGTLYAVVKKREVGWEVLKLSLELEIPMKEGWSRVVVKDLDDSE